jgi:hypothetical protein
LQAIIVSQVGTYLLITTFHPSSCFRALLELGEALIRLCVVVELLITGEVVVKVTVTHCAAAVATVIGDISLILLVLVYIVDATALVISDVVTAHVLSTCLELERE